MSGKNVLISSAGRRVSLVRDFKKSLNALFPEARVIAADAQPELSAACVSADYALKVPRINDADFIPALLNYCNDHSIGMIIPTIDTELLSFAHHRAEFEAAGVHLIVSDMELVYACRNKRLTHDLFSAYGMEHALEVDPDTARYPVFSKPEGGSSSIGIHLFHSIVEVTPAHRMEPGRMFLEYLDPKVHTEFTVDLYYDRYSTLKCCVPRQRIETRSGEVNKGITRRNSILDYLKKRISLLKGARGCITLQVFQNDSTGRITGIEINPRFGGGYPLSYAAGADFPTMLLKEYYLGEQVSDFDTWEADLLMLRYDNEVLIHGAQVK
jgi:carbamoyl-phosphate synthase large subunit